MQLLQTHRTKRKSKSRILIILVLLTAIGVGAWQSWDYLQPRYLLWKQQRALNQAKDFIAKRDAPNAQIALEVALRTVPGNPETLRVAADMLEQVGAAQSMRLRRAVVQAVPDSVEDVEALVVSCLRFRDFNAARDALTGMTREQSAKPAGLRAALAFALATDNAPVADALFQQLETDLPKEDGFKIAHDLLYLRHPNEDRRRQAQAELEKLAAAHPEKALNIWRAFASNAMIRRDYTAAAKWFNTVVADPGATVADRLQKANLDLLIEKRPFEPIFAALAPLAAKSEADAAQFAQWLLVQGRSTETAQWIDRLPAAIRDSAAVKAVRADTALQNADWDQLATLVGSEAWGPISKETIRFAMAAHTVDSANRPALRHETWDLALDSARGSLATLRILQKLAAGWQWDEESERTLWTIARAYPDQTWAHQSLFNLYRRKKDTKSLRDVIGALRESEPTVARYQHDWALFTLLIEPSNNWNPAKDIMRQLYEGDPTNPTYVTGYGFALAQAGKASEALAVVEKLPAADRDYPPRQPYLAFIYGVARKPAELERTASLATTPGTDFLPEEAYLFTRARAELERKPEKPKAPTKPAPAAAAPKP